MTSPTPTEPAEDLRRSETAKAALAAWVNVPVDQLPAEKMWIEHPNDLNRQAWDRVIAAIEAPILSRLEAAEKERDEAIREMGKWAREAGEAKGRLEMSEAVGIVDGWRERAEKAEAQVAEFERIKSMAATGTAENFLSCDDETKRLMFAIGVEESARRKEAEADRDDYSDRLHDLVMIDSEERATGGGPGFRERSEHAWTRAREPFEP